MRRSAYTLAAPPLGKRPAVPPCRSTTVVGDRMHSGRELPVVGEQIVDAAVRVGGQACQHIVGVGPRIVAVQLG